MRPILARVILAAVLVTGTAEARDTFAGWTGAGSISCGAWSAARRDRVAQATEQWLLGFLTGVAYGSMAASGPNPLAFTDPEGAWAWIDNYCREHPIEDVTRAAVMLTREPRR